MIWHIVVFVSLGILARLYTSMLGAKSQTVASTSGDGTGAVGTDGFYLAWGHVLSTFNTQQLNLV